MSDVKPDQSVMEYQNACTNGQTTNSRKIASGSPRNTTKKLIRSNVSLRRAFFRRTTGGASVTAAESIT